LAVCRFAAAFITHGHGLREVAEPSYDVFGLSALKRSDLSD